MIWSILKWLANKFEDWSHALHRAAWRWESRNFPHATSEQFQEIVETTVLSRVPKIVANVTSGNALYLHLTRKGK